MFSDKEHTAEAFELKAFSMIFHRRTKLSPSISRLIKYWQQLDLYESTQWDCPSDAAKYKKVVEKKRIYKFLFELNKNLDDVRGRILATRPLANMREVTVEVRLEESREKVNLSTGNQFNTNDDSALVSRKDDDSRFKKGKPCCEHCKKSGHTRDTHWDIYGKPQDWKPKVKREGCANQTIA